jgi:hypothetical protein
LKELLTRCVAGHSGNFRDACIGIGQGRSRIAIANVAKIVLGIQGGQQRHQPGDNDCRRNGGGASARHGYWQGKLVRSPGFFGTIPGSGFATSSRFKELEFEVSMAKFITEQMEMLLLRRCGTLDKCVDHEVSQCLLSTSAVSATGRHRGTV